MKQSKTLVIGLTGNSGSGKSCVSEILLNAGAKIIDADKIAHAVLAAEGAAYNEVVNLFGGGILTENGEIDRAKIAAIVFSDKQMLKKHTEITHKHIIKEVLRLLSEYKKSGAQIVVIDAPLLTEAGLHKNCDYVWLVSASYETKLKRIIKRDSLLKEAAEKRLASGSAEASLKPASDFVIENNGGFEELEETVMRELKRITENSL
ncbi:MAG: dephospho-CoA kinase [Clostridiales bacterium]|jgi:dephospho-CoA kinase|nr:dephospho-CoA kinase [Clostridiales bacterium]